MQYPTYCCTSWTSAHWTVYLLISAADVECKGDETAKGQATIYLARPCYADINNGNSKNATYYRAPDDGKEVT